MTRILNTSVLFSALIFVTAGSAHAATVTCYGGLTDDSVDRFTKLSVADDSQPQVLTGYKAREDVGGWQFTATIEGSKVRLQITKNGSTVPLLDETQAMSSADVEVKLDKNVSAYMNCDIE